MAYIDVAYIVIADVMLGRIVATKAEQIGQRRRSGQRRHHETAPNQ